MKNWFTSLNGAIALSIMALLSEAWRGFLDAMFAIPVDFPDATLMNLAAVIFVALFAGWAWALLVASRGSRGGLMAAFTINAVVILIIPVSWLLFYCPSTCRSEAGIFNLANTLNLILGLLAAIALGIQILQKKPILRASQPGAGA